MSSKLQFLIMSNLRRITIRNHFIVMVLFWFIRPLSIIKTLKLLLKNIRKRARWRWTQFNFAKTLTVRIFYMTNVLMHDPVNSMKTFYVLHLPNGCNSKNKTFFIITHIRLLLFFLKIRQTARRIKSVGGLSQWAFFR